MDFLADNNLCGQTLLNLVSRANAVVAEILRLSKFIPQVYVDANIKMASNKYFELISDFSYFRNPEAMEGKITAKPGLEDLDEEFKENNLPILTRFYQVFQSIHHYVTDLIQFLEDLDEGVFIQQTLDTVLQKEEGIQLFCESVYLYGVMLLLLDKKIPGLVRERLLVSFYRYSASKSSAEANIDDVCKLLRSTGYSNDPLVKRLPNYPQDYFRRIALPDKFISLLIGRLRSDDIYNQMKAYPLPEHRSAALSTQAGILFVVLFFQPSVLQFESAKMREIVDKFFPDNWVVNVYMGLTVNLIDAWAPYKAAASALSNTLQPANIKHQAGAYGESVQQMVKVLEKLLKEGVLTQEHILDSIPRLMSIVNESNVTLRWIMLHTHSLTCGVESEKKVRQALEQVLRGSHHSAEQVFKLLLLSSQFELKLKEMFKEMLDTKVDRWRSHQRECRERMGELSEVFSGTKVLSKIEKNNNLQKWFSEIEQQIELLDCGDDIASGRKIVQLIQALEEVEEFHQLANHLQVLQYLKETRTFLHQMLRTINVNENALIVLQIVTDLSYAWDLIEHYTPLMQQGIQREPSLVTKLRATFLKLSSALDLPLLRINQARSPDLVSVSQYYSAELVHYVRQVLQIIPQSMFRFLAQIISLQTEKIRELPTRLDKDKLKDFAQLPERHQVAKLTHAISVFTEGILMTKTTLVGIIEIDPKQLLEDGIRKELVSRVSLAYHEALIFSAKGKMPELTQKLTDLAEKISGYQRSFEYIQDYVCIYGLKIWHEELSRIINFNVEQECNSFLRKKIFSWQSFYHNATIPIPEYLPIDSSSSVNFVGRLARQLLRLTSPKTTCYVSLTGSWYDGKTKQVIINIDTFTLLERSIGVSGLHGLDRLLSFMIVDQLQGHTKLLSQGIFRDKPLVQLLQSNADGFQPLSANIDDPASKYGDLVFRLQKLWPIVLDSLLQVGQMQIFRIQILSKLHQTCKFHSKFLASALHTMNEALLVEIERHYHDPSLPYPEEHIPLMYELSTYLELSGMIDPLRKIYTTTSSLPNFGHFMFLFVMSQLPKLTISKNIGQLTSRKTSDQIDGYVMLVGLTTVFKQFHQDETRNFIAFCAQFVRSQMIGNTSQKNVEMPADVAIMLALLQQFAELSTFARSQLEDVVPSFLLEQFKKS